MTASRIRRKTVWQVPKWINQRAQCARASIEWCFRDDVAIIRWASYSPPSDARARHSLLGVNALIEGVKARVSNYLPALVSLAGRLPLRLITPRSHRLQLSCQCYGEICGPWESCDKFRVARPVSLCSLVIALKLRAASTLLSTVIML